MTAVMEAVGYFLTAPSHELVKQQLLLPEPGPSDALVEVEACGLCHTDLAFASGAVAPRHALPLVLGHEVTGRVVAAGEDVRRLLGVPVLVPAVLPCGECAFCRAGRSNVCPHQKMPGNDMNGGFASHLLVPGRFLVPLDEAPAGFPRADLSVVADAVSTAYQAVRRSGLQPGDVAFVVGAGGVGGFVAQVARALGARVVALDVREERLAALAAQGIERTVPVRGEERETRAAAQAAARAWGVPSLAWRIFECSGTPEGQSLAFTLLAPAATLVVVGFTPEKVRLRLSNLMAHDATLVGTWGCPPEAYPAVLRLVYQGKVAIAPFVARAPMSDLNHLLDEMAAHRLERRMVLLPS
jgi:6-hydroxycyclohex-1-ene-1-carbonyl-CoA dehydrogenase